MSSQGMSVETHDVEGNISLTTQSRATVPSESGRPVELPLVGRESPTDCGAQFLFKALLFCREHWLSKASTSSVFVVSSDVAGRGVPCSSGPWAG